MNYIKKLLFKFEPRDLRSIEDAYNILEGGQEGNERIAGRSLNENVPETMNFEGIGTVMFLGGDFGIIDNGLYFESPNITDIKLGSTVCYLADKEDNKIRIIRILRIISDDRSTVVELPQSVVERIFPAEVIDRKDRIVLISSIEIIEVNLNNIEIDFIPLKGDLLSLTCVVDENKNINATGSILEIKNISPLRYNTANGFISFYNHQDKTGFVEKKIFFHLDSCVPGYIPRVKDKVDFTAIECKGKYIWRAIKIIPLNNSPDLILNDTELTTLLENKNNVSVSDIKPINVTKIGDKTQFTIIVTNNSSELKIIEKIELQSKDTQLRLIEPVFTGNAIELDPEDVLPISFIFVAKFMGTTKELLVINFKGFSIGRLSHIQVAPPGPEKNERFVSKEKSNTLKQVNNYILNSPTYILSGQNPVKSLSFSGVKLPYYNIPNVISSLILNQIVKKQPVSMVPLVKISKSLVNDLTMSNYADRFHMILFLEEVQLQLSMQNYNMERVCFVQCNEYLVLHVENLIERRPSIIVGDRVIATSPYQKNLEAYEGFVHKTGDKQVYLKFSFAFHNIYKGEEYNIQFCMSRTNFRKAHLAIDLAARNLNKSILFPKMVKNKSPQLQLVFNVDFEMVLCSEPEKFVSKSSKQDDSLSPVSIVDVDKTDSSVEISKWFNTNLNKYQKMAVVNILRGVARPLPYLIFGPPGTGKTSTLVETILQIIVHVPHSRLLICAPSNSAADLIALRLIAAGNLKPGYLVRMLAFSRLNEDLIPDALMPYCISYDMNRDINSNPILKIQKHPKTNNELMTQSEYLGRHKITVSTCVNTSILYCIGIPRENFTHIIIDEAAQTTEPDLMIPLSMFDPRCGQIILAGDPLQLGPIVYSTIAKECGYGESYFERLVNMFPYIRDPVGFPSSYGYDHRLITRLVYNYRSLPEILHLSNQLFYNSELIPVVSDSEGPEIDILRKLEDYLPKSPTRSVPPSIVFHGVRGENYQTVDSPSWYNPVEAAQVFYYVTDFYKAGFSSTDIGIITPYARQGQQIRSMFAEVEMNIPKIGSVEEFQGQEFPIIILSLVRSSEMDARKDASFGLGFISSPQRLNVAISRARALLIIIGNPHLLIKDFYWRNVLLYAKKIDGYTGCDFPRFLLT